MRGNIEISAISKSLSLCGVLVGVVIWKESGRGHQGTTTQIKTILKEKE